MGVDRLGDETGRGHELLLVLRAGRHRERDAVRGEDEAGLGSDIRRQRVARRLDMPRVGPQKSCMIMPAADVRDVDVSAATLDHLQPRIEDVLSVLSAARVRLMGRHDEADRPPDAFVGHLRQRVGYERMPVAHTDVDGQPRAALPQAFTQPVRLATRERGDGGDATKELVVTNHFLDPCRWHLATTQHVVEEGSDLLRPLWATEGDEEYRVERFRRHREALYLGIGDGMALSPTSPAMSQLTPDLCPLSPSCARTKKSANRVCYTVLFI